MMPLMPSPGNPKMRLNAPLVETLNQKIADVDTHGI